MINEFSDKRGFEDSNRQDCDWIELINIDSSIIDISSYFLSDNLDDLHKWRLPKVSLFPMQKLLILCSKQDRRNRIKHFEDIINSDDFWRYFPANLEPNTNWNLVSYNDSSWSLGLMGFGGGIYNASTNITGVSSFYLRKSFEVLDKEILINLILDADYDDAFIAYINGIEIARSNNIDGSKPNYSQLAWYEHDGVFVTDDEYDRYILDNNLFDSIINIGTNVLAIQVHNSDTISNDMYARFFLHAGIDSDTAIYNNPASYFNMDTTYYHTNFKISNQDVLSISDMFGNILDQKNVSQKPLLVSEGCYPDGSLNWGFFSKPTPGFSNNGSQFYNGVLEKPIISMQSGWYTDQIYVTIETDTNSEVYYTTNGNIPDTNDFKYNDTLFFDSTTVLSARSFSQSNMLESEVCDRTYILNEDNFNLPVFSIITDSLNLWDWDTGIYVLGPNAAPSIPNSGANFWKDWSRFSRLEFFDSTRQKICKEYFDLEIHGGRSRSYSQKSFRLDFKSRYSGDIEYPLFNIKPNITSFNNINLRNGGSWPGNIERIRDGFLSNLSSLTNLDFMAYEPCLLYLNGVYWGQYGIREKIDGKYIEDNYAIDSDFVDLLNRKGALEGSDREFINSYHEIMNTDPTSSNFFSLIDSIFDINNYIDYFIFETYMQNKDWYAGKNNIKLWREKNKNGKWRYVLFDTDQTFWLYNGSYYDPNIDFISHARDPYHIDDSTSMRSFHSDIFNQVLFNDEFKCLFANRYADLVNSIFDSTYFSNELHALKDRLKDAIPSQIIRWGVPNSLNSWESYVNNIISRNSKRNKVALNHVSNNLLLDSLYDLNVSVLPDKSGYVKINSLIPKDYPWNGVMINYICPSILIAIPDTGFVFSHWYSSQFLHDYIYDDTLNLSISRDDTITAYFRECRINNLYLMQDSMVNSFAPIFDDRYGPYTYQWFLDDDTISAANDSIFYPIKTGLYRVSVTDKDGCNSISNSIFFDCNILVKTILIKDTTTNSLHINSIGGTHPYSYQWFIDSILVDNSDMASLEVYTYGTYFAVIEDINGCQSFSDTISQKKLEVSVFPNPTSSLLNLQFIKLHGEKYTISVFDLNMNLIHFIKLPEINYNTLYTHSFNLDINNSGLYLIRLESSNTQISKRFIYLE